MTPTPYGEGKTVTSIGLAMALSRLGHKSAAVLRQPSLGPVFGIKGGAAGGGRSTVEPEQEINLGLTGDIDAVGTAHNLLSAMVDNHIFHGNELDIDPQRITWQRAMDMEDRALRHISIKPENKNGVQRDDGFLITAASEIMAILSLAKNYADLKKRLGQVIIGYTRSRQPIRAAQLLTAGAMASVLRQALHPNLVQTIEGTPALIHGGAFANIAQGTASLISIMLGLQYADYSIVEAGFGSDLGAEKFVDIVARIGHLPVDAAVVIASIRALKHHGRDSQEPSRPGSEALRNGLDNLSAHIENLRILGLPPVVAINKFPNDTKDDLRQVKELCETLDVNVAVSTAFEEGSRGVEELAKLAVEAAGKASSVRPLYPLEASLEAKLETIVTRIYGGQGVDYTTSAREDLGLISELGLEGEAVCVAKTPLSLSDDPTRLGRPRNFRVTVRKIATAAGAGFNIAQMGDVVTMPGLPRRPAAEKIDIDDHGVITGLQ